MLFLVLQLGDDRYALNTGQITEILPMVRLTRIPQAPRGVAGAFNYRGVPVPVIDLTQLTLSRPARVSLTTRLVLVTCTDQTGSEHLLGLITERATDTIRLNPMDFAPFGIANDDTACLGPVAADDRGLIRWVDPVKLLPLSIDAMLSKDSSGQ